MTKEACDNTVTRRNASRVSHYGVAVPSFPTQISFLVRKQLWSGCNRATCETAGS